MSLPGQDPLTGSTLGLNLLAPGAQTRVYGSYSGNLMNYSLIYWILSLATLIAGGVMATEAVKGQHSGETFMAMCPQSVTESDHTKIGPKCAIERWNADPGEFAVTEQGVNIPTCDYNGIPRPNVEKQGLIMVTEVCPPGYSNSPDVFKPGGSDPTSFCTDPERPCGKVDENGILNCIETQEGCAKNVMDTGVAYNKAVGWMLFGVGVGLRIGWLIREASFDATGYSHLGLMTWMVITTIVALGCFFGLTEIQGKSAAAKQNLLDLKTAE